MLNTKEKREISLPLNKNSKTMGFTECGVGGTDQCLSALQGGCFRSNPVFWDRFFPSPHFSHRPFQTGNFSDYSDFFFFWNRKTVKLWFVATYISQAMAKACKQQPVNDDKELILSSWLHKLLSDGQTLLLQLSIKKIQLMCFTPIKKPQSFFS